GETVETGETTDSLSAKSIAGAGVSVSLPQNATAAAGSTVTIPVSIGALPANTSIESFDFSVFFDPAVLQPTAPSAGTNTGTLSSQCSVFANSPSSGEVIVSGACGNPPITTGSGVLYNLTFTVIGTSGQQTGLRFNNPVSGVNSFQFNNGSPAANTTNGSFSVLPGPTAASVTVSGKVTNASGRGIAQAQITLIDANGRERTTQTTSFGYYRFENIEAGETITITAKARRYKFIQSSITRTVNQSVTDADFVSER
ncbi:MAG TPA: cohesin domain-containing protein, partial [Pyrinomonadaceae bacterium]